MANETIEDIVRDVRNVSELHGMSYTRILADRIEAAHKREIIVERNLGTDEIDMAVAAKDATIARLKEANARMREALLLIAGGKDARRNYEEVAWHMAQWAAEALAVEGEAK